MTNLSLSAFVGVLALLAGQRVSAAPKIDPKKLNVHLIMHSHDDPGWLKTVDQYYTGSSQLIYLASVEFIFDSVITELSKNPDRHFTFCEISFFSRWWYEQTPKTRALVKQMIESGQINFVNGGWVMHDEAGSHFVSMIDQTTLGHKFLKEELNYYPRVGWQIDPFGHSNTHAWLSSAVGFDSLFFGRIDYQDHNKRMDEKRMEMIWKGSASDTDQSVFTGVFTSGNYGPPKGFCFDTSCHYCRDDPVVDDLRLKEYNADVKVKEFIAAILEEQSHSLGNNIMLKMGADFTGDNVHIWFKSIDKLIAAINAQDPRFNLFYSDPSIYTKARAEETVQQQVVWETKTDDFFPYSDHQHAFWAGYFTSRPTLKYFERQSSSLLQALKQIAATPSVFVRALRREIDQVTLDLTAAVGLINHHDAITGTAKQHVTDDYFQTLSTAVAGAESLLGKLFTVGADNTNKDSKDEITIPSLFTTCRFANESICDATQALQAGDSVLLSVYNPLPRSRSQQIVVPLNTKAHVTVLAVNADKHGVVTSDVVPNSNAVASGSAPYNLVFTASELGALTSAKYLVHISAAAVSGSSEVLPVEKMAAGKPLIVSSDKLRVTFNADTGLLESVTRLDVTAADGSPLTTKVSNDLAFYKSFGSPSHVRDVNLKVVPKDGRDPHEKNIRPLKDQDSVDVQASGAYIFRPSVSDEKPTAIASENKVEVSVVRGKTVTEVHQKFGEWASQFVRLREGSLSVELEWTVGPVPVEDGYGKEVVSRFSSDLNSGAAGRNKFFTDSNGREFMERVYNYRPTWELEVFEPVSGNYYPLTASMFIQDEERKVQLAVLTDRAQAGASLASGEMELMVHRRLLVDDIRGVGEPLDETTGGMIPNHDGVRVGPGITVTGKHYLLLSNLDAGVREVRTAMDELFNPALALFATDKQAIERAEQASKDTATTASAAASLLSFDLPVNVQLVTLQAVSNTELLVRLGHAFAVNEDAALSAPVEIDLFALLSKFGPVSAQELTLSANQLLSEQRAGKIDWTGSAAKTAITTGTTGGAVKSSLRKAASVETTFPVTLSAMQIKTFAVQLK